MTRGDLVKIYRTGWGKVTTGDLLAWAEYSEIVANYLSHYRQFTLSLEEAIKGMVVGLLVENYELKQKQVV